MSIFRHRRTETPAIGICVTMFCTKNGTVWRGPVDTGGTGPSRHAHLGAGTHTDSAQTLSAYAAQSESLSHWTRSLSTVTEQDVVSTHPTSINPATLLLVFRTNLSSPPRRSFSGGARLSTTPCGRVTQSSLRAGPKIRSVGLLHPPCLSSVFRVSEKHRESIQFGRLPNQDTRTLEKSRIFGTERPRGATHTPDRANGSQGRDDGGADVGNRGNEGAAHVAGGFEACGATRQRHSGRPPRGSGSIDGRTRSRHQQYAGHRSNLCRIRCGHDRRRSAADGLGYCLAGHDPRHGADATTPRHKPQQHGVAGNGRAERCPLLAERLAPLAGREVREAERSDCFGSARDPGRGRSRGPSDPQSRSKRLRRDAGGR